MTLDDFRNDACRAPDGVDQVYLRCKRGRTSRAATTVETIYLAVGELAPARIDAALDEVRERWPTERLWVDALGRGHDSPYAGPVELPRTIEQRPSQLPADTVRAAAADPTSVLVGGLVTLSLHFRDIADRHLDTIDHLSDQLREYERELGRLRARAAASTSSIPLDDELDDDQAREPTALDNLTDVVAGAWAKVQQAQAVASDPIGAVKSALRSMSPRERAERIASFLSDPEVQSFLGPDDDAPGAPPPTDAPA